MKVIYPIVVLSIFLIACHNQTQSSDKALGDQELQTTSDARHNLIAEKLAEDPQKLNCLNLENKNLSAFNEVDAEPKCQPINILNSNNVQCEISEDAFGGEIDPLSVEENGKILFVFRNLKECNQTLKIRNSNAP